MIGQIFLCPHSVIVAFYNCFSRVGKLREIGFVQRIVHSNDFADTKPLPLHI